jgi:GT2 family glycosyltransferase
MWIDSDQVFEPSDFFKLLEHEKDIVSALIYKKPKSDNMHDLPIQFACNITPDRQMFSNEATGELIKVWTNGMGWMLVKKGVFEKVDYPWFYPIYTSDGIGMHGEDISFQIRAKEAGFDSFVDTSIIVGHEKNVVLI